MPGAILFPYHEKSAKEADFDPAQDQFELAKLGSDRNAALVFAPAAAPAAARPLPAYAAWKAAHQVIVHTSSTIEARRGAFGTSVMTPADRLSVRNNLPPPDLSIVANRDAWVLDVEGVGQPRSFTLAELRTMGLATVAAVLQCSGNGRSYFESKPSGTKWQVGAAGCVIWSGVPVRNVVAALGGLEGGARFVGPDLARFAWRQFVLPVRLEPRRYLLASRAQDAQLNWQAEATPDNSGWRAHAIPLRVA